MIRTPPAPPPGPDPPVSSPPPPPAPYPVPPELFEVGVPFRPPGPPGPPEMLPISRFVGGEKARPVPGLPPGPMAFPPLDPGAPPVPPVPPPPDPAPPPPRPLPPRLPPSAVWPASPELTDHVWNDDAVSLPPTTMVTGPAGIVTLVSNRS
ncbi:hypothetical protein GBZ48_21680 [Azospirillum melinis]|uniref:Uncharacterized protein n=1 Tax=Azospirillum melinis TaxID=328839 RepID=A0ABX2KMN0_9PROT|nr:hypothetical protein [Azospirillum melinis]